MQTICTPKTPQLLQLTNWIFDPVSYLEKTAREYPDVFQTKVIPLGDRVIIVSNPKILQHILSNDRKQFIASGESNKILSAFLGNYSLIMLEGDRHRQRRQLLMPSFHGQQISNYASTIIRITRQIMEQAPVNQVLEARNLTQAITMNVIMEAIFGLSSGQRYERLKKLLTAVLDIFRIPAKIALLMFPALQKDLGRWSPWGNFQALKREIDELIYAEISQRRQLAPRGDILSLLLSAQDAQGNFLRDEELRDELITLLFAGHETTATALAWGIYWTHYLPAVKARILAELASLENPDPLAIARLPYLNAVCQETLRIYPVGMLTFPRIVPTDMEIEGYFFPAHSIIMGSIYQIHHREDIYPQPYTFKPERFLEKQFSPYEFLPFGGGVRRCLGEALALFEFKLALVEILSHYQIVLATEQPEKPQRRGLTLAPARGVPIIIKSSDLT